MSAGVNVFAVSLTNVINPVSLVAITGCVVHYLSETVFLVVSIFYGNVIWKLRNQRRTPFINISFAVHELGLAVPRVHDPVTIVDIAIDIFQFAFTMLVSIEPKAVLKKSTRIEQTLLPLALVNRAVEVLTSTVTFLVSVVEAAYVLRSFGVEQGALALLLPVNILSLVDVPVCIGVLPEALLDVIHPLALVSLPVAVHVLPVPMLGTIMPVCS